MKTGVGRRESEAVASCCLAHDNVEGKNIVKRNITIAVAGNPNSGK